MDGGRDYWTTVLTLALYGEQLLAGGNFDTAGGEPAAGLAAWDGTQWTQFGGGLGGPAPPYLGPQANALLVDGDRLYVAGVFTIAGPISANGVVVWNGTAWEALGSALWVANRWEGGGYALALWNGDLYVGGDQIYAGGTPSAYISRWKMNAVTSAGDPGAQTPLAGNVILAPASPTPSRGRVTLRYMLPHAAPMSLRVYASDGALVATLAEGAEEAAGHHTVAWDGADAHGAPCPQGLYWARLAAEGEVRTTRILLLR